MLTDTQIRNLKPAEKAKKYADGGVEVEARVPAKYSERFREWELRKKS